MGINFFLRLVNLRKVDFRILAIVGVSFALATWSCTQKTDLELIYMHQDQVIKLPDSAEVLSGDEFCPFSAFSIGDHILSMQGHPEFSAEFTQDLIALRSRNIGQEKATIALESLSKPHDGPIVGQWIVNFFCDT